MHPRDARTGARRSRSRVVAPHASRSSVAQSRQTDHKVRERIILVVYGIDFQVLPYPYGGDPDLRLVIGPTGDMLHA